MKEKVFSQEGLKLMACITMLIDHVGASMIPNMNFRIIGRLSFPIYCFLLAEGIRHTRDVKKYTQRLTIGALLAEIPFDLLFFGRITWEHQNIMVTLLLGMGAVVWGQKINNYWLPIAVSFFAAEYLCTDYGGWGVALICLFAITEEVPHRHWLQFAGMALIFWCMDSYVLRFGSTAYMGDVMKDILFKDENGVFSYRVAGICIHRGKVLLQTTTDDPSFALPGGHVAFGETSAETLIREFREELGADITVGELKWVAEVFFPWGSRPWHQICLYYSVEITDSVTPREGIFLGKEQMEGRKFDLEFHWVPLENAKDYEIYPTQCRQLLENLDESVTHFVYEE